MSTIKIEITLDSKEPNFNAVIEALANIAEGRKYVNDIEILGSKEVKAPTPAKTPAPRPSRVKPKPTTVEEPEDDDEDFSNDDAEDTPDEDLDEEITADDLRALQATKIDKHRPAIAEHYGKLGAKGISSLAPEKFQKMFDFLSKLK